MTVNNAAPSARSAYVLIPASFVQIRALHADNKPERRRDNKRDDHGNLMGIEHGYLNNYEFLRFDGSVFIFWSLLISPITSAISFLGSL